jgi:hypothetical protein
VVEGGTLLRCYTSQRGIEGSNPSSSASRVAHLQHKRESKDMGRNSVPYFINRYTNAGRKPISVATNATFVTVNCIHGHQKLWSPSRRIPSSLDQNRCLRLLICRMIQMLRSMADDESLTVSDICKALGIGRTTFYRYVKANQG